MIYKGQKCELGGNLILQDGTTVKVTNNFILNNIVEFAKGEGIEVGIELPSDLMMAWFEHNNPSIKNEILIRGGKVTTISGKPYYEIGFVVDKSRVYNLIGFKDFRDEWEAKQKEQPSAEQLANNIGFKIDDKCFDENKNYYGEIVSFDGKSKDDLIANFEIKKYIYLKYLTNKVAIHCPTKEDFEFICKLFNITIDDSFGYKFVKEWEKDILYFGINEKYFKDKSNWNNHLTLTIKDYCKAMGINPLFVTEDSKYIYEGMDYWAYDYGSLKDTIYSIHKVNKASCTHTRNGVDRKYFSTKEAAKDFLLKESEYKNTPKGYLKVETAHGTTKGLGDIELSILNAYPDAKITIVTTEEDKPIIFYTEDFADGSFPVKSCGNCSQYRGTMLVCNSFPDITCDDNNLSYCWQGELKGEPIRKGNKGWERPYIYHR